MIVSGAELQIHQIQCAERRDDEDELHEGIVDADECCEQVQISAEIHDGEEDL